MDKEKKQSDETSIALLQKDVTYILDSVKKIDRTMEMYDRNFARKDELKEFEKIFKEFLETNKKALEAKVDKTDFDPIKKTLTRINWLVISAVVIGLLALIFKA